MTPTAQPKAPLAGSMDDFTLCSLGGCGKRAVGRGLCRSHYTAAWRRGEMPPLNRPDMVRVKFHLPRTDDRRLRRIVKATGETYAALLRSAVTMFLDSRPPTV